MRIAFAENDERVEATPECRRAVCPSCRTTVIARCGEINVWHWAHESTTDCDPWHEGISDWHLAWQDQVPPDQREVVIGPHRADIRARDGTVFEVQMSPLSPEEIREREDFYGNMVWILHPSWAWVGNDGDVRLKPGYFGGRVIQQRPTFRYFRKPVIIDDADHSNLVLAYDRQVIRKKIGSVLDKLLTQGPSAIHNEVFLPVACEWVDHPVDFRLRAAAFQQHPSRTPRSAEPRAGTCRQCGGATDHPRREFCGPDCLREWHRWAAGYANTTPPATAE